MHGVTLHSILTGKYALLLDEEKEAETELIELSVEKPTLSVRLKSDSFNVNEFDSHLTTVNRFTSRKPKEQLFLNKFLTVHKRVKDSEYSLWTLKGLFNFIDRIISEYDTLQSLSIEPPKVPSPFTPTMTRQHHSSSNFASPAMTETVRRQHQQRGQQPSAASHAL